MYNGSITGKKRPMDELGGGRETEVKLERTMGKGS